MVVWVKMLPLIKKAAGINVGCFSGNFKIYFQDKYLAWNCSMEMPSVGLDS
jgi:hypothetical protein